ncbi:peptidoglycan editing factor PgeF [Prodigiosinella confusarubida]|uniref:Purine nucleoside phosphorylase n=1 Tax=Serratia sp. (strain ATCC 39006) TaxID=104623 RepID=A0A2I5THX1_SERS3|nr:purine nucleoside phosphorylase YfiH [Serratia sp. ATCC 39006]AUG99838.1 peptidoglycan editing factor PgeF [Serratia sp. ATCC 39006]AUH04158.1 peptidoglycan editing factor PgeF [Serratia sp. ATCC 39006]
MLIQPNWPAPHNIRAYSTTRIGGVSMPPYDSFNLGNHVGDDALHVYENRNKLVEVASLPSMPYWLEQVHGTQVVELDNDTPVSVKGDAVYTRCKERVCAVMTADCLPVLFCTEAGDEVAAAHAGWRGLQAGVLEQSVLRFRSSPSNIMAWLGPAIGPRQFEVGAEVKAAFTQDDPQSAMAFVSQGEKFLADIYQLARLRLQAAGVTKIFGGEACTVSEPQKFFSYRRDGVTGRMATLVWVI